MPVILIIAKGTYRISSYQIDIDYHEFIPEILSMLREILIEIGDTSLNPQLII